MESKSLNNIFETKVNVFLQKVGLYIKAPTRNGREQQSIFNNFQYNN